MYKVIFKHQDQRPVYPPLLNAVIQVCNDFKKDAICSSGYRSLECQKATAKLVLAQRKGSYQTPDGAVYTGKGKYRKCWSSAYGESNHCYTIAMDMDGWLENLTNEQLKKYGLVKPMAHEPWHITLIELVGISKVMKTIIRDSVLKGVCKDMNVVDFQVLTGLEYDGISGAKTKEKAKDMLTICYKILDIPDFNTSEEVIKATQNNPKLWLGLLKTVKYFDSFIMNIIKKMKGE